MSSLHSSEPRSADPQHTVSVLVQYEHAQRDPACITCVFKTHSNGWGHGAFDEDDGGVDICLLQHGSG